MFDTGLMELAVEVQCDRSVAGLLDVAVMVKTPYAVVEVTAVVASAAADVAAAAEAV